MITTIQINLRRGSVEKSNEKPLQGAEQYTPRTVIYNQFCLYADIDMNSWNGDFTLTVLGNVEVFGINRIKRCKNLQQFAGLLVAWFEHECL